MDLEVENAETGTLKVQDLISNGILDYIQQQDNSIDAPTGSGSNLCNEWPVQYKSYKVRPKTQHKLQLRRKMREDSLLINQKSDRYHHKSRITNTV